MKIYRQNDSFICRAEEDKYLFYNKLTGQIHILNWSAHAVWSKCNGKSSIEEIKLELSKEYEMQPHVLPHIDAIFGKMEENQLILEA